MNKCEGCGARVDVREQCCPYCGSAYPQQVKENNSRQNSVEDSSKILNQPAVDPNYKTNLIRRLIPGVIVFFFFPLIGIIMIINAAIKSKKA